MNPQGGFSDKPEKIEKEGAIGIKTRNVIYILAFTGFAINFVIGSSFPLAIVDMVDANFQSSGKNQSEGKVIASSECIIERNLTMSSELRNAMTTVVDPVEKMKYISLERRLLDLLNIKYERNGFKWNEHIQAQVLGSFFWFNWATQIPGGVLAAKYGTKFIFGFAQLVASIISMLMPLFCYLDYRWMVALRMLQGFILGSTWPAMHNLIGKWVPPNERSMFVTVYFGTSVGAAIAFPLFGQLIKLSSWEWTFHASGFCGIIWYMFWQYYVYDTPEQHPRIDPREKKFILQSLGSSVAQNNNKKAYVPWKAIFTSKALLINIIGQWAGMFGFMTILTQPPSYFKNVHGWGSEATGLLSGLPHLPLVVLTICFSKFADYLLSSGRMTMNNVRRFAAAIGMVLNGLLMLGVAYSGCNGTSAVIFLTLALCSNATGSAGVLSSIVDMAPNYAGITMGIVSTIAVTSGFISPIVVGYITFENQTVQAWQHIFQIYALILIGAGLIYICFNDSTVQKWNNIPEEVSYHSEEMKPLKSVVVIKQPANGAKQECNSEN